MTARFRPLAVAIPALLLSGCMFGPDYERPTAPTETNYKELEAPAPPEGWKAAEPADTIDRGHWWVMYRDPLLDSLMREVEVSNQTLAANEAAFRQAAALADQSRAGLYPTISLDGQVRRSGGGSGSSGSFSNLTGTGTTTGTTFSVSGGGSDSAQTHYQPSLGATWDLDVWGRIRRTIESDVASAQASAADLAAAKLSAQAELATDYFQLRALDEQKRILDEAASAYERSLAITRSLHQWGVGTRGDVAQAQAQLETTRAQSIAVGVQRAQLEHAIAVLVGRTPADLAIAPGELPGGPDPVPPGLPSALLERRPDIAAAERRMAAASAQIGVARAAYFPDITLSSSVGFASTALSSLFDWSNLVWSATLLASQTLIDGGARTAQVEQARAAWDQAVANYRQTALAGFQDVEDQLSGLRILALQAEAQARAVAAAREAERLELNQYRAGTVAYTSVVTAQQSALSNEQTALGIRRDRFTTTVALIRALGGGWHVGDLPATVGSVYPRL